MPKIIAISYRQTLGPSLAVEKLCFNKKERKKLFFGFPCILDAVQVVPPSGPPPILSKNLNLSNKCSITHYVRLSIYIFVFLYLWIW